MKRIILYIAFMTLLSGCSLYRKFQPTTEVDKNLFGEEYTSADTTTIASLSWRELFQDKHLQSLIDTALVRNTDLRTAHLRIEQAKAVLMNARLSYLPSVELSAEGTANNSSGTMSNSYTLGGLASWEIDVFGKNTNAKRGAQEAHESSIAYAQAVQTSLLTTVANGYYTLLVLDEQLRISKETLGSWQQSVRVLESLKQGGSGVTEAAVLQARANCMALESEILSTEKSIKESENALCTLMTTAPTHIQRGSLIDQQFPSELSIGIPLQLLANRPDIKIAEHQLAQAFYATNIARASFYPSISLSGSFGWTNSTGGVELNPAGWLLNAIGSLVQPIFNRGANIANLKTAKAEQDIAVLNFQQSLLNAGAEVNNALTALQTARLKLNVDSEQVAILQEAVRKTELLMHHSSTNYLDVLTAQQSLLNAEKAVAQDRFDEIQSIIALYNALGGGSK